MSRKLRILSALLGGGFYLAALFLPVFQIASSGDPTVIRGYDAFEMGWNAWADDYRFWQLNGRDLMEAIVLRVAWLANLYLWAAAIAVLFGKYRTTVFLAGAAVLFQLPVAWYYGSAVAATPAYVLWILTSIWLFMVGLTTLVVRRRRSRPHKLALPHEL